MDQISRRRCLAHGRHQLEQAADDRAVVVPPFCDPSLHRLRPGGRSAMCVIAVGWRRNRLGAPDRRLDLGHTERPGDAVVLGDGDVLTHREAMPVKLEDRLVVVLARRVGERPAPILSLKSACRARQACWSRTAAPCTLPWPWATDRIEMSLVIQRRGEFVAMLVTAIGKIRSTCQFETDALQAHGPFLSDDGPFNTRKLAAAV